MRLLLDENLPTRLRHDFLPHDAFTVRYKGWKGKKNGELLKLMLADGFDALVTRDRSLQHQQNFLNYPITVFVLKTRDDYYQALAPLVPRILEYLDAGILPAGIIIIEEDNPPKT